VAAFGGADARVVVEPKQARGDLIEPDFDPRENLIRFTSDSFREKAVLWPLDEF
jgi:hypothetical protein